MIRYREIRDVVDCCQSLEICLYIYDKARSDVFKKSYEQFQLNNVTMLILPIPIPNDIRVGNLSRKVKFQRFEKLIIDSGFLILKTSDRNL